MGRSKEMGKPVEELTLDELQRELIRCQTLSRVYANNKAGKGLRKRLLQVERRLEDEYGEEGNYWAGRTD
ncbi:MAG: hypothetical protein ACREGR_04370 [Minisyncoccia bacterium]